MSRPLKDLSELKALKEQMEAEDDAFRKKCAEERKTDNLPDEVNYWDWSDTFASQF